MNFGENSKKIRKFGIFGIVLGVYNKKEFESVKRKSGKNLMVREFTPQLF